MALSVVKRPIGFILDTTAISGTVSTSGGFALITKATHGLVDGAYVYIYSVLGTYNGYWYVVRNDANSFFIREYSSVANQSFINSGSISYYVSVNDSNTALTQNWNCVHLPIVYKLKSTVWPINGVDTARSITTFSNSNGYTYIVAAGDIKTVGTASSLEQVILLGTSVDGVYKIVRWYSDTNFVIDLAYSAANVLSSGTVQYYYFNYCARIRVYAGIPAAHFWTAQKPYALITEQKILPDSTGLITFNISEYIKKQISILTNNSIKDTLPNNIDAWCNFYITYAESYDDSNMYTVTESIGSYADDSGTFEGYAVNAKLPFKTRSAGALSPYVSGLTSTTKQKWLTVFSRPTLFAGKYFDISYIKNTAASGDYIKREVYVNSVLKQVYIDTQTDNDQGIYRYAITQSGWSEDRVDITYYNSSNVALSETLTIDVNSHCSFQDFYLVWLNYLGGYDYWNFTARKNYSVDILESKTEEVNIYATYPNSYGEFAESITKQTIRRSKNVIKVTSQFLTTAQEDAIKLIVSSPLVQICTSQYDRQTLIVDANSLPVRRDQDKTRKLTIGVMYTDEIPTQTP